MVEEFPHVETTAAYEALVEITSAYEAPAHEISAAYDEGAAGAEGSYGEGTYKAKRHGKPRDFRFVR